MQTATIVPFSVGLFLFVTFCHKIYNYFITMKYLILLKFIPFEMAIISMVFLLSFKQLLVNDYYTFISIVYGIVLIFSGIFAYLLMDKKPISSNWKLKSFLGKFLLLFFINMWLVPFV